VKLDDSCINIFNQFKLKNNHKYITFRLSDDLTKIIIDKTGSPSATYDEFLSALPEKDCRYAVVNMGYDCEEGYREKILFFLWTHETSSIKLKMIYAGSKATIKSQLNGLQIEIQGGDKSDFEYSDIIEKCKQFHR